MSNEETYTYRVFLGIETPHVGVSDGDEVTLEGYGYSDQDWDALTAGERETHLEEWAEENFWNSGYGYYGEVKK